MAKPKRRKSNGKNRKSNKSSLVSAPARPGISRATLKKAGVICSALLLMSLATIAGVTTRGRFFAAKPSPSPSSSPPPQGQLTLAKEYIYGPGGRILATEEPSVNAPSNLRVTSWTGSTRTLVWNDNSDNEDGFRIDSYPNGSGAPLIYTVAANVTTFTESITPYSCYSYVVRAFKGALLSDGEGTAACPEGALCPTVSTLSGSTVGYLEGTGTAARWTSPTTGIVAKDPATGLTALFVTDTTNHRIRKICLEGANAGLSSLVAGTGLPGYTEGNGVALNARYNYPRGITAVLDGTGTATVLYVADTSNHMIRKLAWNGSSWTASKLAGGVQPGALDGNDPNHVKFNAPQGVTVAPDGFVYVADTGNGRIRKINQAQGATTTLVNSGTFNSPVGIVASANSQLYVSDSLNHRIYQVTTTGSVTIIAGSGVAGFTDGVGTAAAFNSPNQLGYMNSDGIEAVFIADRLNNRIRMLRIGDASVVTYGGTGAAGSADGNCNVAQFNAPGGVAYSSSTHLTYVIDTANHRIRIVQ